MASKFSHLPDISTIQPDRLIKYRVSEDRFSAEVLLPGLSYTDFDQKIGGKVSLWSLGKVCESARWQGLIHGLTYYPELRKENAMFAANQSIHFSKEFSDISYGKHFGEKKQLKANIYICNVGKTSYTITVDIFDYKSGIKLVTNSLVGVNVNRKLRKPALLPKFFYENLEKHLKHVENNTIGRAVLPTIPNGAFRYEIKCVHSDSDMNKHITQVAYSKFCSDAASLGALKGHFSQFKRHIELYPLKTTEFHFIGEALVNDIVVVHVWEEPDSFRTLNFAITRKGKIILILKMEFYEGSPADVSPHLRSKL
ncbi:uncharacterized protein LOC123561343 isoform X5 [Mercenaria mercenaria]|uniref:uncharacterized protein LOC123561343 isoform X5 n=1 Tax=Mercenaria mercenaria TaxID=6596 RepID=UPI00234EF9FA|nr:uncharacterized protein LOC123561343 isoform X5 [Mercenaria mercenaria]